MHAAMPHDMPPPAPDPRQTLTDLVARHGESLSGLSRFVGRNPAYLQQYVSRGSPRCLPEDVRGQLARYFGIDERQLGARDPWRPS